MTTDIILEIPLYLFSVITLNVMADTCELLYSFRFHKNVNLLTL